MKTRYKILIIVCSIFLFLLVTGIILNITLYKTWGNNEHFYVPINGMEVICDVNLFTQPSNCHPVDQDGKAAPWPKDASHMGMFRFDDNYIGGGSIDLDPDLSPSYAYDFAYSRVLISLTPMILFFTLPYIPLWLIEKYKKIPAKSLQKLFLAVTALYFGGIFSFTLFLTAVNFIYNPSGNIGLFGSFTFPFVLMGIPLLALGIVLLYKSPIIRRLLKR